MMCNFSTITTIIESIVTSIAIIIGGIWTYIKFIKKREKYPRIIVKHEILNFQWDDKYIIHLIINIDNISDVLMTFTTGEVRLCQVLPVESSIKKIYKESKDILKLDVSNHEAPWPELFIRIIDYSNKPFEIEPGESEQIHCDFIISQNIKVIEVYSHLENEVKAKKSIGWNTTSIHDLTKVRRNSMENINKFKLEQGAKKNQGNQSVKRQGGKKGTSTGTKQGGKKPTSGGKK